MPRMLDSPLITAKPVLMKADDIIPLSLRSGDADTSAPPQFRVHEVSHQMVPSTPLVRRRLQTDAEALLLVEQLGVFEDEPLYLRSAYYCVGHDPWKLSQQIKALDAIDPTPPLRECFEHLYGEQFGGSWTAFEAVRCEQRTAQILGVAEHTAVLMREMVFFDIAGRGWELSFTYYRSDRIVVESLTDSIQPSSSSS